jgi:hypothetical protein
LGSFSGEDSGGEYAELGPEKGERGEYAGLVGEAAEEGVYAGEDPAGEITEPGAVGEYWGLVGL